MLLSPILTGNFFFSSDNIDYVDESLKNKKKKKAKEKFHDAFFHFSKARCTRKVIDNLLFHVGPGSNRLIEHSQIDIAS